MAHAQKLRSLAGPFAIIAVSACALWFAGRAVVSSNAAHETEMRALHQTFMAERDAIAQAANVTSLDALTDPKVGLANAPLAPAEGIRLGYALVHVHPTPRAASHGHDMTVHYHPNLASCNAHKDSLQSSGAACIPAAIAADQP